MYGYAFRLSLRYQAETWQGLRGLRAYFQIDLTKGQISSRGQVALEMPIGQQNLVGRTPDQSVV